MNVFEAMGRLQNNGDVVERRASDLVAKMKRLRTGPYSENVKAAAAAHYSEVAELLEQKVAWTDHIIRTSRTDNGV